MAFHSRTTFTHSPRPISLPSISPSVNSATTLPQLCESSTPPCALNPFLFNGHLQTLWTASPQTSIPIHYKRHVFSSLDPSYAGEYAVDFVVPPSTPSSPTQGDPTSLPPRTDPYTAEEFASLGDPEDTTPMVVALHGLSGGSHELYLRHVLAPLVEEEKDGKGGWAACVINSRGCAGSKITNGVLYNARATWDMRQTVRWLREKWPKRELFGLGFSLGANILTNYLGEEGADCELKAAVLCSNPWNLEVGSVNLQSSYMGRFYSRVMATGMRALVERHYEHISTNSAVDIAALRKTHYMFEFDSLVQCPTWGYPTVGTYYRDASSADALLAVRTPTFAINAKDDPIACEHAIPYDEFRINPWTVLCATDTGGHLAWFEFGGGRWFVKPAVNFLEKMAREVDTAALQRMRKGENETVANGHANGHLEDVDVEVSEKKMKPEFDPVRRRMKMPMKLWPDAAT